VLGGEQLHAVVKPGAAANDSGKAGPGGQPVGSGVLLAPGYVWGFLDVGLGLGKPRSRYHSEVGFLQPHEIRPARLSSRGQLGGVHAARLCERHCLAADGAAHRG
jgi:hypothetical protein